MHQMNLNLPDRLYKQILAMANEHRRSMHDEAISTLAQAYGLDEGTLSPELEKALARLDHLDDQELREAAASRFGSEAAAALEQLHFKEESDGLNPDEVEYKELLVRQYEHAMVLRARALALLRRRGIDIDTLLTSAT